MNESSSSGTTVRSWPPNEILGLGDQLVQDLGLQDSSDTLGRWMAHHLAGLIASARSLEGGARVDAEAQACDLILRLWENRVALPGRSYPLARWSGLLAMLHLLDSETSPFTGRYARPLDSLITQTFLGLRTLVQQGLVLAHPAAGDRGQGDVSEFLDANEAAVLQVLERWEAHIDRINRPSAIEVLILRLGEDAVPAEPDTLDDVQRARIRLVSQIDDLLDTLGRLKAHLLEDSSP